MDTLVGSPAGASRLEVNRIADGLLRRLADSTDDLRFDEATMLDLYTPIEAALYEDVIDYVALAPLQNLVSPTLPIALDSEVAIDAMTDEEIAMCIRAGLIETFGDSGVAFVQSNCAVRHRYHLSKVVGETPVESMNDALALQSRTGEIVLAVVQALRLFKAGEISSPGFVQYSPNWLLRGHMSWQPIPSKRRVSGTYQLSADESGAFSQLWSDLHSEGVTKRRALGNALRRFGFAGDRERPEDRIIDLMIAAESLFLTDAGDPEFRGELRYRLALRSAFFIEMPGRTRRQVFHLMGRAYDTRSRVVHGGEVNSVDVQGEKVPLGTFTDTVEEHLRTGLKKAVQIGAANRSPQLVDWEGLILDP